MKQNLYTRLEAVMLGYMTDSAHDKEHVYRVLYQALDIASREPDADTDILIAACLLHDIGREAQFKDPAACHARKGAEMAQIICIEYGYSEAAARHIADCISTHRYRGDNPPQTIEAKILFDADKLDVTGAVGIARTLFYQGIVGQPLYRTDERGYVSEGTEDTEHSFMKEYNYKLKNLYDKFFTARAREIAAGRREAAQVYYESLLSELSDTYETGRGLLEHAIEA